MKARCYRGGQIGLGVREPKGAITFASGSARKLRAIVSAVARHAYDGKTLLVPGIPEAENDDAALAALERFQGEIRKRLELRG